MPTWEQEFGFKPGEKKTANGVKTRQNPTETCPHCKEDTGIIRNPNAYLSTLLYEFEVGARDIDFLTKRTVIDNTELRKNKTGSLSGSEKDKAGYLKGIDIRKAKGSYHSDVRDARSLKKDRVLVIVIDTVEHVLCYKLCDVTNDTNGFALLNAEWHGPIPCKQFIQRLADYDKEKKNGESSSQAGS